MSIFVWVIAAILSGIVAVFLIMVAVGVLVSSKFSGHAYMKKKLKRNGLDTDRVPNDCIDELVSIAHRSAEVQATVKRDKYAHAFVSMLDTMVGIVRLWISNPNDSMFWSHGEQISDYRRIFEKYDVK